MNACVAVGRRPVIRDCLAAAGGSMGQALLIYGDELSELIAAQPQPPPPAKRTGCDGGLGFRV